MEVTTMYANQSSLQSAELRGTVQALRALRSGITQTLERLESDLVEKDLRQPPPVPRINEIGYTLLGQTFRATNGNKIFIEVLRHFADLDETFPVRYSMAVRQIGRTRHYVARRREDVYPGKPKLLSATAQFAPSWFVGTNEDNGKKLRLLRVACDVLDLQWNQDLKVRMPKK